MNAEPTTQSESASDKLDTWALVEIMGHQKIAGHITEQTIAGSAMLRVDVPACGEQKSYTRFYGASAIYSISPTTEEIARAMAKNCCSEPVSRYELPRIANAVPTDDRPSISRENAYAPHDSEPLDDDENEDD
jgi:hypothetical protein